MKRYVFAVRDQLYCVWGEDLTESNERFLQTFDPGYFEYVARRHLEQLEGEDASRAAVALRATYHHGLESLFSLLGALSQAPECVAAWIPKCSNTALRHFVRDVNCEKPILTQRGLQSLNWTVLAKLVHSHVWLDDVPNGATAQRYGALWSRFAVDILDDLHVHEYNSIKHGFRVSSGGSFLRIGREPAYGVAPPESEMRTVGASPHGTSFFVPEPIPATEARSYHLRLRRKQLNWRAEAMVQAVQLVSWSINNVVGFLRVLNGAPAGAIKFNRPEDASSFEAPWRWSVGVLSFGLDFVIDEGAIEGVSRSALRAELEGRSSVGNPG